MPDFSLTVETTSNATAGAANLNTAIQILMPASRDAQLIAVLIRQLATASPEHSGRWTIDRISAVSAGSALTPLQMSPLSAASAISNGTQSISTTLIGANTSTDAAIVDLHDGWNYFNRPGDPLIFAGAAKGFALRRSTAPTGSRVVIATMIWRE